MKVRFLQTTPSLIPDFPFQPGQIITVARLTPELRQHIRDGRAAVLNEQPEAAVLGQPPDTASVGSAKGRGAR